VAEIEPIKAAWQKAAPTIEFLQQNPQFMSGRPAEPQKPAEPQADPDLVELDRLMDYYDTNGQPDLTRAARYQALQDKRAGRVVEARVGPVEQSTAEDRARQNWGACLREKLPTGQPIDPNILAEVWREMPTAQLADPRVARVVLNQAKIMQMERSPLGAPPDPPKHPPLVTEPTGGGPPRQRQTLNDLDRRIAEERGMTEEKYGKLTEGFVKGRTSVLED